MKRVLVVDDDPNICDLIRVYFDKEEFTIFSCLDGDKALDSFNLLKPDIIIMEVMLPGRDGLDICKEIRKTSDTPIIMISTRGDTLDIVIGLELGADDYLQKPFDPKELLARVKAVIRRCENCIEKAIGTNEFATKNETIEYPGLRVDKARYVVYADEVRVEMPPKELELLFFLASHPNRVFTREQLLGNVWGYDFYGESRTVDVHVKRIREKLDSISSKYDWKIKTVWGVGYKFEIT
jgi:DNA-binding response OmpR family regulator